MAYTTPFTAVAGTAWKASDWNTYGRDDIAWLATDSPCCTVYNNGTQATTSGVGVAVTFDSEVFDNAAMHSTSSSTNRITVPSGGAGKYLISFQLMFTVAIAMGSSFANIGLNSSTIFVSSIAEIIGGTEAVCVAPWSLSVADWVSANARQDSGSGKNIGNDTTFVRAPWFSAFWFRT